MSVLDPNLANLYKDGRLVDGFRVASRVVELALKQMLSVGVQGLRAQNLPATISLCLDRPRGTSLVQVHPADRDVALRIARHVRVKLHASGWSVVGALVKDAGGQGNEHDLVVDEVAESDAPRGLVSCELKCRRLWSESGLLSVRKAMRKEQEEDCAWWQAALRRRSGVWRGRMIVLVICDRKGAVTGSRAEWKAAGGEWRTLWGWPAALPQLPPRRAPQPAPPARAARPTRAAPAARPPFPAVAYRRVGGRLVGPVAAVFAARERPTNNIGRDVQTFKRRHPEADGALFQAPRKATKKGGKPEWVATEPVLRKLHVEL